jgi:hypothetical protein
VVNDREIEAMTNVFKILSPLDEDERIRVLVWIQSKFKMNERSSESVIGTGRAPAPLASSDKSLTYEAIGEVLSKASPKLSTDRVLLVASHLQESEKRSELTAREINQALNHLGYRVLNITQAITGLMSRKPSLIIQTRKEGRSQQSQKKYRVTTAGIRYSRELTSRSSD